MIRARLPQQAEGPRNLHLEKCEIEVTFSLSAFSMGFLEGERISGKKLTELFC